MQESYKKTTIVFPKTEAGFWLGMKKQGFGEGWWNGFGGKLEANETYEQAARRETREEADIEVGELRHIASLHFFFDNVLKVVSKAYVAESFTGEPIETEEMRPQFFDIDELPYETMWQADRIWIPRALVHPRPPRGFVIHFTDGGAKVVSVTQTNARRLESKF